MGREDVTVFVMALAGMISTLVRLATVCTPAVFMVLIPERDFIILSKVSI